jgi:hypothetical protein
MVRALKDGAVTLYHDGDIKAATTSTGIDVTGNIVVSGTVDGRDIATDGSKLDGIESGATTDQTQSEINALGITATGLSGTPNITVGTINSDALNIPSDGTNDTRIEIGTNTLANHNAYIDLVSDTTYTDYGLRFIRYNGGANTASVIAHRGTGNLFVEAVDAGAVILKTNGSDGLTINSSQNATFSGTVNATAFYGDGSNLTGVTSTTINNNADNRIITGSGTANTLNAESGLTYDGSTLSGANIQMTGNINASGVTANNVSGNVLKIDSTTVVDNSRNLTNIGTISSGVITADGLTLGSNEYIQMGGAGEFQIFNDGSNTVLRSSDNFLIQRNTSPRTSIKVTDSSGEVQLSYAGSPKLATTSTGIDVTGTVTADGLTVDGDAIIQDATPTLEFKDTDNNLIASVGGASGSLVLKADTGGGTSGESMQFHTGGIIRQNISAGGDISFYEDTGSTVKFFWDASAESLGIGTSSPSSYHPLADNLVIASSADTGMTIVSGTSSDGRIFFADGTSGSAESQGQIRYDHNGDYMAIHTADDEKVRIDSSGRVGIGTDSPDAPLHIIGNDGVQFNRSGQTNGFLIRPNASTDGIRFTQGGTGDRMTIDSSGNVGIGCTPTATSNVTTLEVSNATTARILVDSTGTGGRKYGWYSSVDGQFAVFDYDAGEERMRIDSLGRVGIGGSPSENLSIIGSANTGMNIQAGTSHIAFLDFGDSGDTNFGGINYNNNDDTLNLRAGNSNKLTINSLGRVGIGNNNPSYKLSLKDTTQAGTTIQLFRTGSAAGSMFINGGLAFGADGGNGDTQRMVISSSTGNVGIGCNPSAKLDVNGEIYISPNTAGKNTFQLTTNASNDARLKMLSDTTTKVDIQANGSSYFNGGKVGIGSDNPTDKVQILDSGNLALRVESTGAGSQSSVWTENNSGAINGMFMYGSSHSTYGAIGAGEGAFYSNTNINIMSDSASGVIKFSTGSSGGSQRMTLDSSGQLVGG